MSDQIFFDTNTIVYLYSDTEINKRSVVERFLMQNSQVVISTQVINEFVHVMHRKRKITYEALSKAVKELSESFIISYVHLSTVNYALKISEKYRYSYFDSLIIASAIENNCNILYTEDLHNTHIIEETLEVRNPFSALKKVL